MQLAIIPKRKSIAPAAKLKQTNAHKTTAKKVDSLDKYKLSRLDALKFKMELQTKNLMMLTGYGTEDTVANIKKKQLAHFQNLQLVRIEKDLERTSRQLQQELTNLQTYENGKLLNPDLLTEIDSLFDNAEAYFNKKQQDL